MAHPAATVKFLAGLDDDLYLNVLAQLREVWTYNSTAIEGNTLTLAETHLVLADGLTVKGKPLKDHNEVLGHARGIDILFTLLDRNLAADDLFSLHRAMQTDVATDIMRPNGAWKREPNGSWNVDSAGNRVFIEYATPEDVAQLMEAWLAAVNDANPAAPVDELLDAYARLQAGFTAVHPFWDGNGRIARLVCNVPLLKGGHPS